jgi:hypothetical protein
MMASEKSKLARWENYIDLGAESEFETQRDAIQERVRRAAGRGTARTARAPKNHAVAGAERHSRRRDEFNH